MATSNRAFLIELYREYLEEASFLYEQRLGLLRDPEIPWPGLADFEGRLEAQIDGLVVGEELALEVCRKQAAEGDFGELHGAVLVFCRQNRKDLLFEAFENLDADDDDRNLSVTNALKNECPETWFDELTILSRKHPKVVPILSAVAGYRRLKAGSVLVRWLKEAPGPHLRDAIWALGRLRERGAAPQVCEFLRYEEESTRSAAALALLRMGEPRIVDGCLKQARSDARQLLFLGLGGPRSVLGVLRPLAQRKAMPDCLLALGLLGDVSAVPLLISSLAQADSAEFAALALHIITGADLIEEVLVPEEIKEDELSEEERKQPEEGKVPTRLDGKPFGSTVKRISQKAEDWDKWWSENRSSLDTRLRYRSGRPYSPAVLLENLESSRTPRKLRELACEELAIRYGVDVRFEVDMFVDAQMKALATIARWVETNGTRFQEGAWYYAGSKQSDK